MDLNYEDVHNILKIIDGSSLEELHLEIGDFKLVVRRRGAGAAAPMTPPDVPAPPETANAVSAVPVWPEGGADEVVTPQVKATVSGPGRQPSMARGVEVKAPMVGTFYRAPAPGAPPFVEVGSVVAEDDTVCIIEVMKLMNSIKAGCRGRVVEVSAEDGTLVEFGQTLMVIEPTL